MKRNNVVPSSDANNWLVFSENFLPSFEPSERFSAYERLNVNGVVFARRPDGRFADDKAFSYSENWTVLFEGVLLNKSELMQDAPLASSIDDLLIHLLDTGGVKRTLGVLRGPFSGAFLDRRSGALYVFANQTGDTAAYSYAPSSPSLPVYSNDYDALHEFIRRSSLPLSFDERAARMMLSYGFMTDQSTFAEQVKRIAPGTYHVATRENGKCSAKAERYYALQVSEDTKLSLDEAAVAFQDVFVQAVRRCFEKDIEYGFPAHLVDMSGGLDSRVVNVAAKILGYKHIVNMSYSQSTSNEARYSILQANRLGHEIIYFPLDSAQFLRNPLEILRLNGGAAYYAGITGGHALLRALNFNRFGLEHTGQLGGAVLGSFIEAHTDPKVVDVSLGRYSEIHDFKDLVDKSQWTDAELFFMETRGYLGTNSTHLLRRHYTYAVSPFLDVDVLDLAFSIPHAYRADHRLFHRWLQLFYPEALHVPTTRKVPGGILQSMTRLGQGAVRKARRLAVRVASRIGKAHLLNAPDNMNPFDYWVHADPKLLSSLEQLGRPRFSCSKELGTSLDKSLKSKNTIDKLLAISVIQMHNNYFK